MKGIPTYPTCFVCGNKNQRGLNLGFSFVEETGEVVAEFVPQEWWTGYRGIVHGGIQAAILDEGMGWTIYPHTGEYYLTLELKVRFKKPLTSGRRYRFTGRLKARRGLFFFAEGEITDDEGNVYATGKGIYKTKSPET